MVPANLAASVVEENEAGYVSSIVSRARTGDTIKIKCVDSDFWTGRWRAVFSVIRRALASGQVPDEVRIGTEIKASSVLLESVGGPDGLTSVLSLLANSTNGANLKHYEKQVLEESKKRRLALAGKDVTQTAIEAGGDVALRVMTQHKEAYEAEYAEPVDEDAHPVLTFYAPSELPNPKIDWIMDGYLAKSSVTLVAGSAGAGKSHWVYGMAAALGRGNNFCGRESTFSRSVILSEEPAGMIKEKCDRYGLTDESTRVVHGPQAWTGHTWEEYLRAAAKEAERFQAEVLIVDTFAVWAKLAADDENKSGAIQAFLAPLLQIARTQQIAVVVLHHQGRSGNVRGSTAFEGTVDIALGLSRFTDDDATGRTASIEDDDHRRIVTRLKSRMENTPATLVVRRTRDGFEAEGSASDSRGNSFAQAIIDHLRETRVWTTRAELLGAKVLAKHKLDSGLKHATHVRILRAITAGPRNNLKLYGLPDMTPPDEEARKARTDVD